MRVARLFLFADWPKKYFSGQSEGGISNASGTRSVRVSAQGLSRSCCKLSPMRIPLSRLAAPGYLRMGIYLSKGENHRKQPRDTRCPQGSRLGAIYLPAQERSSKENIPASAKIACLVETGARVVSHSSHMYMAVMFLSADDFLHFCAH